MGVQLNIKDQATVELARELAGQLGKSVTEIIREALQEKKHRRAEEVNMLVQEVIALANGMADHWKPEARPLTSAQLMDSLYDEYGLPK